MRAGGCRHTIAKWEAAGIPHTVVPPPTQGHRSLCGIPSPTTGGMPHTIGFPTTVRGARSGKLLDQRSVGFHLNWPGSFVKVHLISTIAALIGIGSRYVSKLTERNRRLCVRPCASGSFFSGLGRNHGKGAVPEQLCQACGRHSVYQLGPRGGGARTFVAEGFGERDPGQ